MKRKLLALLLSICLLVTFGAMAEGEGDNPDPEGAPGTETVTEETEPETEKQPEEEIPETGMPSLGDSLHRYPDAEVSNSDGSVTEIYHNVTEEDYQAFEKYLAEQKASLTPDEEETETPAEEPKGGSAEETPAKSTPDESASPANEPGETSSQVKTGTIRTENTEAALAFRYDAETLDAEITYPQGTYDTRIRTAQIQLEAARQFAGSSDQYRAAVEFQGIPDYTVYAPANEFRSSDSLFDAALTRIEYYQTPGNPVTLGRFEQDNDDSNGPEDIEWVVLTAVNAEKALLISRNALEVMQYNAEFQETAWPDTQIRTWLNGEFMEAAFHEKETAAILVTDVDNSAGQGYEKYAGGKVKNSEDSLFLLSYKEATDYFTENEARMCTPSEYAKAGGVITTDGGSACSWWLRSPGYSQKHAAYIGGGGFVYACGVNYNGVAVRPAFWISLEQVIASGF